MLPSMDRFDLARSLGAACLMAAFACAQVPAFADEDGVRARQLRDAGKILPLESIFDHSLKHQPGEIVDIELEEPGDGTYIYEVEILDPSGRVWELELDAASGRLLKHELD
jgi:uncharacterized membrane protein YkoI